MVSIKNLALFAASLATMFAPTLAQWSDYGCPACNGEPCYYNGLYPDTSSGVIGCGIH
ncbi:hypothetical protein TI39_contig856g00001 [Zymoseptoria brevis]|uniref:Uncharacterized protein n=1 Tax=Zymoseptoria brevis TaxID=1047168 RepID=A0A0F4GIC9_9PEZI|nr:hypothetical protein TI39_contig856g00001 [Zymoseptoria brevis]